MAKDPFRQLHVVRNASKQNQTITDCYRLLYKKELFLYTYYRQMPPNQKSVQHASKKEIPSIHLQLIEETITQLKQRTFQFKRVPNKERCTWGPTDTHMLKDQMIRAVMALILTNVYEPACTPFVYGYKKGKGRFAALKQLKNTWHNHTWCIKGNLPHQLSISPTVIRSILKKKINDPRFLSLVTSALKHKHPREETKHDALSSVLESIYYHELDAFMKEQMALASDLNSKRPFLTSDSSTMKHSIQYLRYKNQLIIGVSANKEHAMVLLTSMKQFLKHTLNLEICEQQLLFCHLKQPVHFLGYDIRLNHVNKTTHSASSYLQQSIRLDIPQVKLIEYARKHGYGDLKKFRFSTRLNLVNLSEKEILLKYQQELITIASYYRLAHNYHYLKKLFYFAENSFIKTIAYKRNITTKKAVKRLKSYKQGHVCLLYIDEDGNEQVYTFVKLKNYYNTQGNYNH